ncbi:uncharacterized protein TNCV_2275151 [Trichonephila clavipes]|nr:uncharacterized protein TNCV_2275151 [Trichonephila clavipes]
MSPHTITTAVGAVCRCKANAGSRRSPQGLHRRTQLSSMLRLNLDSLLKTTWFVPFCCSPVSSSTAPLETEALMRGCPLSHWGLPSDVTSLIAREHEEKCTDYSHIRGTLLQRLKLTAEKFQKFFSRHRKSPNGTWIDYYFEIRAYFEGRLNELKIDSFDCLKNLMIADQMKERCSSKYKEHYLDIWEELIFPEMLSDKLESFDNIQRSLPKGPRRHVKASETINDEDRYHQENFTSSQKGIFPDSTK